MHRIALSFVCVMSFALIGCHGHEKSADVHNHEAVCETTGEGTTEVSNAVTAKTVTVPVALYGGELKLSEADAVPAAKVVADPGQYKDKTVRITGKVASVCEKKGCWLRVVPNESVKGPSSGDIFIKFRDPPAGRLIPMEAVGHEVVIEGTLKEGKMSEAAARHFLEDGGASQEEIDKIVGPQPQLVVQGPVVAIEGIEKAD